MNCGNQNEGGVACFLVVSHGRGIRCGGACCGRLWIWSEGRWDDALLKEIVHYERKTFMEASLGAETHFADFVDSVGLRRSS